MLSKEQIYRKEYYQKNKEKTNNYSKSYQKDYYQKNKSKFKEYYDENRVRRL